jgi:hypothetical protein
MFLKRAVHLKRAVQLKQLAAAASIAGALIASGYAVTPAVANAAPCNPAPGVQCGPGGPAWQHNDGQHNEGQHNGRQHNGGPAPGGPPGEMRGPDNHDWRPPWNPGDNDWRGRFHGAPWGDGPAPWGWGAPPPPRWDGPLPPGWGPPPAPFNYFGFDEQPVWDPGYNQWGFWFFGVWIPLPI